VIPDNPQARPFKTSSLIFLAFFLAIHIYARILFKKRLFRNPVGFGTASREDLPSLFCHFEERFL
jgi:hypothetical protein